MSRLEYIDKLLISSQSLLRIDFFLKLWLVCIYIENHPFRQEFSLDMRIEHKQERILVGMKKDTRVVWVKKK